MRTPSGLLVAAVLATTIAPAAWAGSAPASSRAAERESGSRVERTIPLPAGVRFSLETDGGSVRVRPGGNGSARLVVLHPSPGFASRLTLDVKSAEGEVRVVAKRKRARDGWFGLFSGSERAPRFELELPEKTPVVVETDGGTVDAAGMRADARLRTAGGSIRIVDHGGAVTAHTSGGEIALDRVRGHADVETSGGRIVARQVSGNLRAVTHGGSIQADAVSGDLRAETSGGSILISEAGGRVDAETSGGSVQASFARGNARGGTLESVAGSIRVSLDPGVDLSIDAETSAGSVRSELPVRGTVSRSALRGKLGKGGNPLRVRASAGSVEIGPI